MQNIWLAGLRPEQLDALMRDLLYGAGLGCGSFGCIAVEIKHGDKPMNSQEIRSLINGRHKNDKMLCVSTGGFTPDARYEADRAPIAIMLIDSEMLAQALVRRCGNLEDGIKSLLPLE